MRVVVHCCYCKRNRITFNNSYQSVFVNGSTCTSEPIPVSPGVPQWSVLGPISDYAHKSNF